MLKGCALWLSLKQPKNLEFNLLRESKGLTIEYRFRLKGCPHLSKNFDSFEEAKNWRDLPERFGDWKNIHRRWSRWSITAVWEKVFNYLAADANNEYGMIDSTIVRAHQHSAGALKKTKATMKPSERVKEN